MWVNPTQYKLVPTADSMSFMVFDRNTTGLPIGNHVGAYNVKRKFDTHLGVDLYVQDMDDVYSVADGVVVDVFYFTGQNVGSYWWNDTMAILVEHNDLRVLYGEVLSDVRIGQQVVAGQKIGQIVQVLKKDKGRPMKMLHLEVFKDGKHIDPTPFLLDVAETTLCKICGVPMKLGTVLYPYNYSGQRYVMWNNNLAEKLVSVLKCPTCGRSEI